MDAIHSSRPGGWIEQPNVSLVHVQAGEPSVGGSLAEHSAAVWLPLDGADGLVAKDDVGE